LENKKNISFMTKYEVPEDLQLVWNYKNNSIWDFVNYYADKTILLNEYYRGYASIFKFSNEHFYNNQIKFMTEDKADAVQKIKVDGKFSDGVNLVEVEKVISIVKDIIKECEIKNEIKTIGILSPIRKQCETISKVLSEVLTYDLIEKYQIECSTAHGYQGNQKSIMINSWVYANNSPFQTLTFISNPNLLNVAITRAEEKVINIYSTDNMKDSLVGQYLASIK
jgi:superfamily I DNA and/or RNA helicase